MSFVECLVVSLPSTVSLVVPTQNVSSYCLVSHGDQHCPSRKSLLQGEFQLSVMTGKQTFMGMKHGQVTMFLLGWIFLAAKVPHPWPYNSFLLGGNCHLRAWCVLQRV